MLLAVSPGKHVVSTHRNCLAHSPGKHVLCTHGIVLQFLQGNVLWVSMELPWQFLTQKYVGTHLKSLEISSQSARQFQ